MSLPMTIGINTDDTGTYLTLKVAPCDIEQLKKDPKHWFTQEVAVRASIQTTLEAVGNNVSRAADLLKINRRTLQRNLFWDPGIPRHVWNRGKETKKRQKEVASAPSQT